MKTKNIKLIAESIQQNYLKGQPFPKDTALQDAMSMGYREALRDLTENLATILKLDNPKFDRDKFIKECGL